VKVHVSYYFMQDKAVETEERKEIAESVEVSNILNQGIEIINNLRKKRGGTF